MKNTSAVKKTQSPDSEHTILSPIGEQEFREVLFLHQQFQRIQLSQSRQAFELDTQEKEEILDLMDMDEEIARFRLEEEDEEEEYEYEYDSNTPHTMSEETRLPLKNAKKDMKDMKDMKEAVAALVQSRWRDIQFVRYQMEKELQNDEAVLINMIILDGDLNLEEDQSMFLCM